MTVDTGKKQLILLPCPFCGNDNDLEVTSKRIFDKINTEFGNSASVGCGCGAEINSFAQHERDYEEAVEDAVEQWNTRKAARLALSIRTSGISRDGER